MSYGYVAGFNPYLSGLSAVSYKVYYLQFLSGAQHKIYPVNLSCLPGLELGVASGDNDIGIGIFADYPAYQRAGLLVGGFRDGAGVDNANVGCFPVLGLFNPTFLKVATDSGCFSKI